MNFDTPDTLATQIFEDVETPVGTGNTIKPSRAWFFTWNNPDIDDTVFYELLLILNPKSFVFQLERGESGTLHYQGCIYFDNAKHFGAMKQFNNKWHLKRCKDWIKSLYYCSKLESRIEGPWGYNVSPRILNQWDEIINLRPWQQSIIDIIKEKPNDRTINVIYDPEGNNGKTFLCKYLVNKYKAIFVNGKMNDIFFAVSEQCSKSRPPKIIIWNITRTYDTESINYGAIESIKDGIFFSGKFKSGMVNMDSPHVLIFTNNHLNYAALTNDRWNVLSIENQKLVNFER